MAKVLQKLDNGKIKSAIQRYDNAVKSYHQSYSGCPKLELAESIDKLKNRPEEDMFWMDALFVQEDKLWAINRSCREGESQHVILI